ncbi:hypothetical protein DFA_02430 [Cavenderia fasciculata]|uniref:Uncharacterized protein n=1 Tax=Cavenderia fasciculata TaxID=261658 RepID=F4PZF3_CACFS|nr:uncharacterized protein DFA_02430 [Cavenderia fasciculata]EGG19182.1 hypothetical protein DFA_02430 [Cavenderia fasciculata]|eukprot:XP_004366815.1 hypothetical protein DFA_02430 [Cavenderia fasciculata]
MWSIFSLEESQGDYVRFISIFGFDRGTIKSIFGNSTQAISKEIVNFYPWDKSNGLYLITQEEANTTWSKIIPQFSEVAIFNIRNQQDISRITKELPNNYPTIIFVYDGADILFVEKDKQIICTTRQLGTTINSTLHNNQSSSSSLKILEKLVSRYNTKCTDVDCGNQAEYLFTGKFKCNNHYDALVPRFKSMCISIDLYLECSRILNQTEHELLVGREYDKRNKFLQENSEGEIELGPKSKYLPKETNQNFKLVTFIGPSGSGKSTLIRGLCHGDRPLLPLKGNQFSLTSSDINLYLGKKEKKEDKIEGDKEIKKDEAKEIKKDKEEEEEEEEDQSFLIADCEGFGGTLNTATRTGNNQPSRRQLVESAYPRIMHSFSDIVVCVCSNSWQERQTISKYVLSHAQHSDAGIVNQGELPHLILVFNKKAKNEMNVTNQEATDEFFVKGRFDELVRPYYRGWSIVRIATDEGGRDPTAFLNTYEELKKEIYGKLLKEGKQMVARDLSDKQKLVETPLTLKEAITQVKEVVNRFNNKIDYINFIEIQPINPNQAASYLFKYFRLLYSELSLNFRYGFGQSIDLLNARLPHSQQMYISRYPHQKDNWEAVIKMLSLLVDSMEPCGASYCDKSFHQHGSTHKSITMIYDNKLLKPRHEYDEDERIIVGDPTTHTTLVDLKEELGATYFEQLHSKVCVHCLIGPPLKKRDGCDYFLCLHCSEKEEEEGTECPDNCPSANIK